MQPAVRQRAHSIDAIPMGHHTFDAARADRLEDPKRRYEILSAEELRWAVDAAGKDLLLDLGSGTGFYTDVIAGDAGLVYAVDIQRQMHDYYRDKGVPSGVELLTAGVEELPLATASLDAAYATMTYHEFASADAIEEIARVLEPGGRLVLVDWAATGTGDRGPPLTDRFTAEAAADTLGAAGFEIEHVAVRPETFLLIASIESVPD